MKYKTTSKTVVSLIFDFIVCVCDCTNPFGEILSVNKKKKIIIAVGFLFFSQEQYCSEQNEHVLSVITFQFN